MTIRCWEPRIHGEVLKLGFEVAQSSVAKYMVKRCGPPSPGWRTFLRSHRPTGPRLRLCWSDFSAFLKSFWVLGVRCRGRVAYWRLFWGTLLRRPRQFRYAIELPILGYHFRRVARQLHTGSKR